MSFHVADDGEIIHFFDLPQCLRCVRMRESPESLGGIFCDAFPDGDGVPDVIAFNRHKHTSPYPGDNGILFKEGESEAYKKAVDATKRYGDK